MVNGGMQDITFRHLKNSILTWMRICKIKRMLRTARVLILNILFILQILIQMKFPIQLINILPHNFPLFQTRIIILRNMNATIKTRLSGFFGYFPVGPKNYLSLLVNRARMAGEKIGRRAYLSISIIHKGFFTKLW